MSGNADYRPPPGFGEKLHLIGPSKKPVWVGKKKDVPKLLTDDFWRAYEMWRLFNLGFGLPSGKSWTEEDQWIVEVVALFEEHYRAHFSFEHGVLARIDAYFAAISKRR